MSLPSLTYTPPIRRRVRAARADYELLDRAVELAEGGQAIASLTKVLEHLFPGTSLPDLAQSPFAFVQGSSRVTVRVDGDHLEVKVPLVRLPTGGSAVAALRYILSKISSTGQLYQPRLRGEDVYLEFRDTLTRLHPAKLLEVLRRMPVEADACDDWLIGQFQAQPLERAEIKPLDDDELARCDAIWRSHLGDVEELAKDSQRKRSVFFLNELTAYTIYRLGFTLPLCGYLGSRIAEASGVFNDSDQDPSRREAALAKFLKEMKSVSREELKGSLGHAEYAISPLEDGSANMISHYFGEGEYMETLEQLSGSGKPMDAALALIGTCNFMLARYTWPEEIEAELMSGLAAASGKPWREAAGMLLEHVRSLAATYGESDDEDEEDDEEDEDEDGEEGDEDEEDDEESEESE